MTVGILALQGDYEAHARAVTRAGATALEVRTIADLDATDGLILPGGESTTMLKILHEENLFDALKNYPKPMFGTCAGAILMAKEVSNPKQESLGLMDIAVERNAYGRQLDSRVTKIDYEGGELEAVFIRAPIIRHTNGSVKTLASYNGDPVLVEEGRFLVATFHPEMTADRRIHSYFLSKL
ncbi:MAG: pyridoxal 5'-phosphate synthase glutaminase subunit PdxT [Bryobacteraceae bacterium]